MRITSMTMTSRGVLIGALALLMAAVSTLRAHDHTLQQFVRIQAAAQAKNQRQTEPAPTANEQACRLTVDLLLGDPSKSVAGLVRITNLATSKAITLADEIQREQTWHALAPRTTFNVPRTKLKVEAFHGLDTGLAVRELDLAGKESLALQIPLTRFYDAAARGLKSGNTHLHLMKLTQAEMDRYLRLVPQADGLDLVFVSLLRRIPDERDYITNTLTDGDLGRLSQGGILFGNGEEHRHNFGTGGEGFGHVMLLNLRKLIEPVSIGPGIMRSGTDALPLQRGIQTARGDGATVIWCHNTFGHEDIPNWVTGLLHAQNIFDGGNHGTYEDTFYRYLNVGMKVPFSTGTDWFIYDFSRVYVPISGDLTVKNWLAQLAAGKSFITNGVFLEMTANGKAIGETIYAASSEAVRITGRAIGRNDFRRIELVHNGVVIQHQVTQPSAGHFTANLDFTLRVSEPGWLALRIPHDAGTSELGKPLFAHTSPIYLNVAGKNIFRPEIARQLLAEMQASIGTIEEKASFANDGEHESVLRVYRDAIAALQKRIDAAAQ